MDDDLRNSLWNAIQLFYLDKVDDEWLSYTRFNKFFRSLWHNYFKLPLDKLDDHFPTTGSKLRVWFYKWKWYEVYDFVEYLAKSQVDVPVDTEAFRRFCNDNCRELIYT